MTRTCTLIAAFLIAGCTPAAQPPSDLTAHYAREDAPPLVAKASAGGDSRVEAGETLYIRRGGKEYVVLRDAKGQFSALADDVIAVREAQPGLVSPASVQPQYVLSRGGAETVAGISGAIWKAHPRDVPSLTSAEAVVSDDAALAPLGKGLALHARVAVRSNAATMGGFGSFARAMVALYDKGAVLRFGTVLMLERIDRAPVAPGEFAVPEPLLDRAALAARLGAATP